MSFIVDRIYTRKALKVFRDDLQESTMQDGFFRLSDSAVERISNVFVLAGIPRKLAKEVFLRKVLEKYPFTKVSVLKRRNAYEIFSGFSGYLPEGARWK